jgi:hypothetical protein
MQWSCANIGFRLDDLLVVDVDTDKGGFDSLQELEKRYGPLDARVCQRSGSGGWHYFYLAPQGFHRKIKFREGLDVLVGKESYVVAAPSLHRCGGGYKWVDDLNPLTTPREQMQLEPPPA